MHPCCYQRRTPEGESRYCQLSSFIGGIHHFSGRPFCLFHIPWNAEHAREAFNLVTSDEELKCSWPSERRAELVKWACSLLNQGRDLSGTAFAGDVALDVGGTEIKLSGAYFPGKLAISNGLHKIDLSYAVFKGPVIITAPIHKSCDLTGAKAYAFFECKSSALNSLVCKEMTFLSGASFAECKFTGFANFSNTKFLKPVTFRGADFSEAKSIGFRAAKFFEAADFRAVSKRQTTGITFHAAIFFGMAGFEGREFQSYLEFSDTVFHEAPRFHDAKISSESTFPPPANFLDQKYVPHRYWKASQDSKRKYYEDAAQAYRALRLAMKGLEAHDEEAQFWQLEMKAKENAFTSQLSDWLPWIFSKLYFLASRYGNSVGLPLCWWALISLVVVFAIYFAPHQDQGDELLRRVFETSMQQTVRPFWIWTDEGRDSLKKLFPNEFYTQTTILWFRVLATFQSIVCLTLLALFGFGLRRKFRMA